jgi:uncharacterized repeat protein (TIGR01451 family)/fimbrial isopeptide formation D2 family protein
MFALYHIRNAARLLRRSALGLALLSATVASAADLSSDFSFTPADATRGDFMDRAGVWNGTTEVTNTTGDTFTAVITNNGSTAFDLEVEVTLPSGFSYVSGSAAVSATGVGTPSISASQSGTTLTFTLGSGGEFDLTGGGDSIEIDFGLSAGASVVPGTYQLNYGFIYGDNENDNTPTTDSAQQNVLVQAGDSVISLTPSTQTVGVAETASWTVTVTNSGFGGLFDVEIDQSAIFNNTSFSGANTTQVTPASPTASESSNVYTIPYLAPGDTFSFTTEAVVAGCSDLGNAVSTDDRTGLTDASVVAAVVLDLDLPLVDFTAPDIDLDYLLPTSVSLPISNVAGAGSAIDFRLATNLHTLPVDISNVGGGFTYNAANGEFTLVSGATGADIADTNTETLTFDVTPQSACGAGGGTITWLALYSNECDQPYFTPFDISSLQAPTVTPSVSLDVSNPGPNRLATGESGSIDINLSADEIALISTDPIVVDITISAGTASINSVTASAGTLTPVGSNYQWSVSKADADAGQAVVVDFTIGSDPCLGGQEFTVSASTSAQSVLTSDGNQCPLGGSGSETIFITNNPGADTDQFFNVTTSGPFEAGAPSTTDAVRDNGEGQFIPIEADFTFGSGYPGQWTGSTYFDDFGGVATQTLVAGSLVISRATSTGTLGAPVAVPSSSFTKTAAGLTIDLDFLADVGFFGSDPVSDTRIRIEYLTTIPDAELSGGSLGVRHRSTLTLNGGDGTGACLDGVDRVFRKTMAYTVQRAVAALGVSMPNSLEICEVFDVVLSLGNSNSQQISRPTITLDTSDPEYEFVLPQTPTYGGAFNSGNITFSPNGGNNPTFEYTGGDLPGNGTITVQMVRTSFGGTTALPIEATVDYDDNETNPTVATDFSASASDTPAFVLTGQLTAIVTPNSSLQVNNGRVEWSVIVQNVQSGTAIGAELLNNIPEFIAVNVGDTNAANTASFNVTGNATAGGQLITFDLGDMASGDVQTLTIIGDLVPGSNCSIPDNQNIVTAQWGCSVDKAQVLVQDGPDIRLGSGRLQVVHNTTNSIARLCSDGQVEIRVKNTGDGQISDINIFEVMPLATTGLGIVSGSVRYSTDNAPASFTSVADPTGSGTSGDPYTFVIGAGDQINVPTLVGVVDDDGSTVNEVIIRFDIEVSDPVIFTGNSTPTLLASGDAALFCGQSIVSPGVPFVIPTEVPDISTELSVTNVNLSLTSPDRVPGASTQVVDWTFEITNSGTAVAENVRVRIPITASGGSAVIFSNDGAQTGAAYTGGWVALNDLAPNDTVIVTVTETLGGTCVDTTSTAEVTWGCDPVAANAPSPLDQPSDNDDTAQVYMNPDISDQGSFTHSFNRRNDARGRIRVSIDNQGAQATNLSITETLPTNVEIDTTYVPIFQSNSSGLSAVSLDATDPAEPVFNFTGTLDFDESFTLEFYVRSVIEDTTRASTFPDLASEEDTGNGLDPSITLGGQATITANFDNSCTDPLSASINSNVDPRQPDLDINLAASNGSETAALTNRLVFPGVPETFNIYVRNEGEGSSVATENTVTVTLGTGWTSPTVTLGGNPPSSVAGGVYTFDPSVVGNINVNNEVQVVVVATPSGVAADPLTLQVDVDSDQILQDGSTVGVELSNDSRAFRVLAVVVDKEFVTGSTTESFTTDRNLTIGEEATFDLTVSFSGGTADSSEISNFVIRDSLGNSGAADRGLGLVSATVTSTELVPTITTNPAGLTSADPLESGVVDFTLAGTINIAPSNDEFTATIVARLLNDTNIGAVNSDNKTIPNNLGLSLDYYGVTYRSNDSDDGFSSGVQRAGLHDQESITVQRPTLEVDKQVRNLTAGGSFANSATGEATNIFEYRVVVTNTDATAVTVPIFDLELTDTLDAKLNLFDGSITPAYTPGADTTGNGVVDVPFAGGVTAGLGGQLTANATTLPIADPGSDLVQLDPGESITIYYFAQADQSVNPSEPLVNDVAVTGDTLPGVSGSQTGTTGNTGDDDGALELTATDDVTITVFAVEQSKVITNTSVNADTSASVFIGEQVEFEVAIVLPLGTAPNLEIVDSLSEEFELIGIGSVTVGSSLTPTNNPPITSPAAGSLPANGAPLDFTWEFGDTVVVAGTEAERTITVRYTTQVRNLDLPSLQKDGTFTNSASYSFDGAPVDITDVTLTTAEAELVVTKTAAPDADLDAGDEIVYTVTIDNATGTAPAYDINILDTLPAGLTYVAGSTTVLSGVGETTGLTGTLGEPDVSAPTLTWGRTQGTPVNLDLAIGGKLVFTYAVTVDDSVEPDQELTNDLVVGWTSLDGDPGPDLGGLAVGTAGDANGERTDTGTAPNILQAADDATVTIAKTTTQTKTSSGDTLPLSTEDDGFRVGDLVTYTIEVTVMEGTHDELRILDTLPAGMAFEEFDAITPASGNDGFTYTALVGGSTAPAADDTGNLVFDLGTVVNAGDADTDNDTLTLVYRARILDVAAVTTPDGDDTTDDSVQTLTNSVTVRFLEADDDEFITPPSTQDIDVKQPELALDKERLLPASTNSVLDGETARFRLTVTNSGDAPAYNTEVLDTLPVGMRTTTPQLIAATLGGNNILSGLTTTYNSTTGEWSVNLSNTQILEPGEELILDYDVTLDAGLTAGQTLTNQADVPAYYSKPDDDTDERREYDNVDPDSEDIITIIAIRGRVFEDVNINRTLNPGESWANGVTVFVNLLQGTSVIDSFEVSPGSGDFVFEDVSSGNYTLIVTDGPTNNTAVEPPQWIFYDTPPSEGRLTLSVSNVSVNNQNFPLIQGSFIDGVVFEDTGIGGGTANDGVQNGGENGIGQVTVRLTDGGSNVYDTVLTNGEGEFVLFVPVGVADGATLVVEQFNLPSYTSTGGDAGTTGGTYARPADTVTFTHSTGVSQSGLFFGDVPANAFLTDGQQVIEPGAVAFYAHTFIAGTGGEVSFDISSVQSPALPGWGQTLFRDTNCNGQLDPGEPQLTLPSAAIVVTAGEQICLIVKDSSPIGAPFGAQNLNTVTATFSYTNSAPALADGILTRTDLTIIGNPTTSGLELTKAVDKTTASPGETITYTLTYTNNGIGELDEIVIYDTTPAFTTYLSTPATPVFPQALTGVVITEPGVGDTGSITWTFTGQLQPGETGTLTYEVVVDQN